MTTPEEAASTSISKRKKYIKSYKWSHAFIDKGIRIVSHENAVSWIALFA